MVVNLGNQMHLLMRNRLSKFPHLYFERESRLGCESKLSLEQICFFLSGCCLFSGIFKPLCSCMLPCQFMKTFMCSPGISDRFKVQTSHRSGCKHDHMQMRC